jgi:hypothetical protein
VGKGARSVGPLVEIAARHSPSKTGVNALVAHAAMASQAILPTLRFWIQPSGKLGLLPLP